MKANTIRISLSRSFVFLLVLQWLSLVPVAGSELYVGAAEVEITPKLPQQKDIILQHQFKEIELPMRAITVDEYIESKRISNEAEEEIEADPGKSEQLYVKMMWNKAIVDRYEAQKINPNPQYDTEIHVIRLGDIVICTNQFELFTDYGIQMKARSKALQTFVIQLAGPGSYLPTKKAVYGGSYSAVCQSNFVGPDGGAILVEETLELINAFWQED